MPDKSEVRVKGRRARDVPKLKTRIISEAVYPGGFVWRAPIVVRGAPAVAQLTSFRVYNTSARAKKDGRSYVKRVFPGIILE